MSQFLAPFEALYEELQVTVPPMRVLTDLTRRYNQVDTAFQLDVSAVLGVQTVLGKGPPFFFVVD